MTRVQISFAVAVACGLATPVHVQPQRSPADAEPAGRRHADAIFHPGLGEIVIAGGGPARNSATPTDLFDDVWSWNGVRWRRIANTGTAQMCGRLIFDVTRNRLLLHGGTGMYSGTATPSPTSGTSLRRLPNGWWVEDQGLLRELVDGKWRVIDADTSRAFCTHVAYHDAARHRLILLGRAPDKDPATWEFDGRAWRNLETRPGTVLSFQTFAFDSRRGRGVLVSGFAPSGLSPGTYEFDGVRWAEVATGGPAPRLGAAAAYEEHTGRTIVYGGESVDDRRLTDTWAWDGTNWSLLSSDGPGPFDFPAIAYDRTRSKIVLFGMSPSGGPLEVWELGRNWTRVR